MTAETSTSSQHRHTHRKRAARIYLLVIFAMLTVANAYLIWFTFSPYNPWRGLIALMVGESIGSALLIVSIWRRQPWARYVLILLLFGAVCAFATAALYIGQNREFAAESQIIAGIWGAVALHAGSATWLIRSKRIQYLATQPGSGG